MWLRETLEITRLTVVGFGGLIRWQPGDGGSLGSRSREIGSESDSPRGYTDTAIVVQGYDPGRMT